MDRIEGVPEGYRLGEVVYLREDRKNITFELIPIEQPKQLEAVIVVPITEDGWYMPDLRDMMGPLGIHPETANEFEAKHPGRVTIREREKEAKRWE